MDNVYLTVNDIFLIIISVFFPPFAVLIKKGCGSDFCINLFLTTLFFFFGMVHAIYLIIKPGEEYTQLANENNESNNNNITNIPENAIVVILPGATVNTNANTIPSNLPPPSYAESEQLAKDQKELIYPDLPSYEATTSSNADNKNNNQPTNEKH